MAAIETGSAFLMAATDSYQQQSFFEALMPGASSKALFPHAFAVEQFVIAVGKTVGFVADALHEFEGSRAVRQAKGLGLVGEKYFFLCFTRPTMGMSPRPMASNQPERRKAVLCLRPLLPDLEL